MTPRTAQHPPWVVVVDDDPLVRRAAMRELTPEFIVLEADCCDAALLLLDGEMAVSAIVSDYHMPPGPDGLELLARVRAAHPRCGRILATGGGHPDPDGLAHVVVDKPWPAGSLPAAVRAAIAAVA